MGGGGGGGKGEEGTLTRIKFHSCDRDLTASENIFIVKFYAKLSMCSTVHAQ